MSLLDQGPATMSLVPATRSLATPTNSTTLAIYTPTPASSSSQNSRSGWSSPVRTQEATSRPTTTQHAGTQQVDTGTSVNTQTSNTNRNRTLTNRQVENRSDRSQTITTGQQRDTGTIVTDTMDPVTRAAYNQLVATLQGGGTAAQRQANANLAAAATNATNLAGTYTADAARQQAQQSIGLYTQQLQESIMPNINAAMEAAGMSGDSMNALLAQDAMVRVSRQAADAELQAILGYSQLQQGQQQLGIAASAQMQADPVAQQLIAALGVGKGSLTTETRNLLSESRSVSNTVSSGQTIKDTTENEIETISNILSNVTNTSNTSQGRQSSATYDVVAEAQAAALAADADKDTEEANALRVATAKELYKFLPGQGPLVDFSIGTEGKPADPMRALAMAGVRTR